MITVKHPFLLAIYKGVIVIIQYYSMKNIELKSRNNIVYQKVKKSNFDEIETSNSFFYLK